MLHIFFFNLYYCFTFPSTERINNFPFSSSFSAMKQNKVIRDHKLANSVTNTWINDGSMKNEIQFHWSRHLYLHSRSNNLIHKNSKLLVKEKQRFHLPLSRFLELNDVCNFRIHNLQRSIQLLWPLEFIRKQNK